MTTTRAETKNGTTTLTEAQVTAAFAGGPHHHVELADGRVAMWRFGQGPDVVLVHGWPLHAATFRRVIPALAKRFTLHVLDLPGAGRTVWRPDAPIGIAAHAGTVRSVVDALGLERFAYLAHDSGGAIARLSAADDPRVTGVVLVDTEIPGHHPWQLQVFAALAKVPGGLRALVGGLRFGAIRRSALGFGGCFGDARYTDGEFLDLFVRPLRDPDVGGRQLALLRGFDFSLLDRLEEVHPRILAPVLCVWGTDDPFFPVGKARAMLDQFRAAELVEIPGAKLFAQEDHPDQVCAAAMPFLAACFEESDPRAPAAREPADAAIGAP